MSSFLYKKIWHGISIHTRKCIPRYFASLSIDLSLRIILIIEKVGATYA